LAGSGWSACERDSFWGWPLGEARVSIRLTREDAGTRVELAETPSAGPGKWLNGTPLQAIIARRNVEALARLAVMAERRTEPQD